MVKALLSHGLKSQLRAPLWQRSLAINIVLGLVVLYFMLNFLLLGYFLDVLLLELFPDESPLEKLNSILLYTVLGGLVFRFFMQSFPVLDIQGYLLLPLRKSKLYRYLLVKSIFNVLNLLPFFFIIPFAAKAVFPEEGAAVGWSWAVLLSLLVLFNNFLAFYLKRRFTAQPLIAISLLAALALLGVLDWMAVLPLSAYLGGAVAQCLQQPAWLLLPLLAVIGAYQITYGLLRRYTYLDALSSSSGARGLQGFAFLGRFGQVGSFLQLELKQIWRNKRPRATVLMGAFFLFYPFLGMARLEEGEMWNVLLMFLIGIVFPMATYGQYLFAWESSYFNLIMARRVKTKEYLEAKYYLFMLLTLAATMIILLYGLIDYRALLFVLASASFSLGVTIYLVLFLATYNTRPVDATKGAMMNWEGIGASQFILVLPTFILPMIFYGLFRLVLDNWGALIGLTIVGAVGILLKKPLLGLVQRQYERQRHILARGYRQK